MPSNTNSFLREFVNNYNSVNGDLSTYLASIASQSSSDYLQLLSNFYNHGFSDYINLENPQNPFSIPYGIQLAGSLLPEIYNQIADVNFIDENGLFVTHKIKKIFQINTNGDEDDKVMEGMPVTENRYEIYDDNSGKWTALNSRSSSPTSNQALFDSRVYEYYRNTWRDFDNALQNKIKELEHGFEEALKNRNIDLILTDYQEQLATLDALDILNFTYEKDGEYGTLLHKLIKHAAMPGEKQISLELLESIFKKFDSLPKFGNVFIRFLTAKLALRDYLQLKNEKGYTCLSYATSFNPQVVPILQRNFSNEFLRSDNTTNNTLIDVHTASVNKSTYQSFLNLFKDSIFQKFGFGTPEVKHDANHQLIRTFSHGQSASMALAGLSSMKHIDLMNELKSLSDKTDQELKDYLAPVTKQNGETKESVDSFKFKLAAALRMMNDIVNKYKFGNNIYRYTTKTVTSCGLSVGEILALSYIASKEYELMPEYVRTENKETYKRETEIAFITALYDIRRGYNIHDGIDDNATIDLNTCQDGAISRLAEALNGRHEKVQITFVTQEAVKNKINVMVCDKIYSTISTNQTILVEVYAWKLRQKMPYRLLDYVHKAFENEILKTLNEEFTDDFKPEKLQALYKDFCINHKRDAVLLGNLKKTAADIEFNSLTINQIMDLSSIVHYVITNKKAKPFWQYAYEQNPYACIELATTNQEFFTNRPLAELIFEKLDANVQEEILEKIKKNSDLIYHLHSPKLLKKIITTIDRSNLTDKNMLKLLNCLIVLGDKEAAIEIINAYNGPVNNIGLFAILTIKAMIFKIGLEELMAKLNPSVFKPTIMLTSGNILHFILLPAITFNDIETFKKILEKVDNHFINYQDESGNTALMGAIYYSHKEASEHLLLKMDAGGINLHNKQSMTALTYALHNKFTDLANKLLDKMDDKAIALISPQYKQTPLLFAYKLGNQEIFTKILLRLDGASINHQNSFGYNALIQAVIDQRVSFIMALLKTGKVELDLRNNENKSAFDLATDNILKLLRDYQDAPLHWLITNSDAKTVESFLNLHPDSLLKREGISLETPLVCAVRVGKIEIIEKLLAKMDNTGINLQDRAKNTALMYAVINNNAEILNQLLRTGMVDIALGGNQNVTAINLTSNSTLRAILADYEAGPLDFLIKHSNVTAIDAFITNSPQRQNSNYQCALEKIVSLIINQSNENSDENLTQILDFVLTKIDSKLIVQPLLTATAAGHIDLVHKLLKKVDSEVLNTPNRLEILIYDALTNNKRFNTMLQTITILCQSRKISLKSLRKCYDHLNTRIEKPSKAMAKRISTLSTIINNAIQLLEHQSSSNSHALTTQLLSAANKRNVSTQDNEVENNENHNKRVKRSANDNKLVEPIVNTASSLWAAPRHHFEDNNDEASKRLKINNNPGHH